MKWTNPQNTPFIYLFIVFVPWHLQISFSLQIEDLSRYTLPITVAIVISGQYEDDLDNCEDVIYTGQGGNNLLGNKHQIKDQKLLRGNLGLKV